jgi:DNA transformation protein
MTITRRNDEFVDYVIELLEPFNVVRARKMFGGYGLYIDNKIFALIIDRELYFKANSETSKFFAQWGSTPFSYQRQGKNIQMSYWRVPPVVLENQELLEKWLKVTTHTPA